MSPGGWIRPTSGPLERRALDALARQIVLVRDGNCCRKCGRGKMPGRGGGLQAAHIFPKGEFPALRYELDNLITLCARCHIFGRGAWHKHTLHSARWVVELLGAALIQRLEQLSLVRRGNPGQLPIIRIYLERELLRLRSAAVAS